MHEINHGLYFAYEITTRNEDNHDLRLIEFSAADGYALHGTLWSPDAPPRALVLIHPATAVPERLYAGFARFLTERGFAALTYNYRGIGASRPARLGALKAACATGWNST